jgi:hypothetical protein
VTDLREQRRQLFVIHRAIYRAFRDLEIVDVDNGQHCARLSGVDILKPVPGTAELHIKKERLLVVSERT